MFQVFRCLNAVKQKKKLRVGPTLFLDTQPVELSLTD